MKTIPFYTFLLACILAVTGCSPSESTGEALMTKRVDGQSGGKIKLVSFKKTNGAANGDAYDMEYEAEVEFLASGTWSRGSSMDSAVSFEFATSQVPQNNLAQLMGGAMGAVNVRQGQHQTVKGHLAFQKTEQGWRGEDGQIY